MRRLSHKPAKPPILTHAAYDAHCYVKSPTGWPYRILRQGFTQNAVPGLVVYPEGNMPAHRCLWLHELLRGQFRLVG